MSASSGIIKSIISANPTISMSDLASSLNELLAREIVKDREMFVTLMFVKFDLEKNKLVYCNAGHLPGLYWNNESKIVDQLPASGPIVGQFPGAVFKQEEKEVNPGDRLFLFTDGLTEAFDAEGKIFGRERAEQVFMEEISLDPKQFCLRVKEWVDRFSQGAPLDSHDDFTVLQVKVG
jgi:phosphoserine phosphatase RsbU/P